MIATLTPRTRKAALAQRTKKSAVHKSKPRQPAGEASDEAEMMDELTPRSRDAVHMVERIKRKDGRDLTSWRTNATAGLTRPDFKEVQRHLQEVVSELTPRSREAVRMVERIKRREGRDLSQS